MTASSERSTSLWFVGRSAFALPVVLTLVSACTSTIGGGDGADGAGNNTGTSGSSNNGGGGGAAGNPGGAAGTGNGSGVGGTTGLGGTTGVGGTGIPAQCADQNAVTPGRAPLRRLTIPEYNNTVRDIIGETSNPAFNFPAESDSNGFGNDAREQWVTPLLADQYNVAAEAISRRVTGTPATLTQLLPCTNGVTAATGPTCARTFIESWVPKAYRRPLAAGEADELVTMFSAVVAIADDDPASTVATQFASGIAGIIEAVLVSPDFLYRVEWGVADTANPALKRPSGTEMATRLSYLFRASAPDDELTRAATAGELSTNAGVRTQAERLLNEAPTRTVVGYFFENLLRISDINDTPRDAMMYPAWSSAIGVLMQQETRTFLENEVFDAGGSGTWVGILTAPYTFVNQQLATYYGMVDANGMPLVMGEGFQRLNLDTTQRLGLLSQGGIMAGLTHSNHTNPVTRGGFIVNNLMCRGIEIPSDLTVVPPEPYSKPTTRERYSTHSSEQTCAGCHFQMDPLGFALENFDAVGMYRTHENNVLIDASGEVPDMPGGDFGDCPSNIACGEKAQGTKYQTPCNGSCATELARKLAQNPEVMACFPQKWLDYAYGQALRFDSPDDVCNREQLAADFAAANFNIKQMLVALTQTDGFLYLGVQE